MKKGERRQELNRIPWLDTMSVCLKGGIFAGGITLLLLLIFSFLIAAGVMQMKWMWPTALIGCAGGSFLGGKYAVGRIAGQPLLKGVGVGVIQFLIFLTAGILVYDTASIGEGGGFLLLSSLSGGMLSGLTARKPKKKRHKNKARD